MVRCIYCRYTACVIASSNDDPDSNREPYSSVCLKTF